MITPCLWAQKKELSQARSYIKSGKDFDKAERLMTDLLKKDTANCQNERIYLTWFQAVTKQYEAANEKLYLRQKYDTAAFFNLTRRLFLIAGHLDTLDATPDEKGRVKIRYREDNAEMLNRLRPNLYYGGTFFVRKEQYPVAFDFFESYLKTADQPLFTGYNYATTDSMMPQAAYWATYAGYRLQDASRTLRYFDVAVRDTAKARFAIQYACEAYGWLNDEAANLAMLKRGFADYPDSPYFFPRLIDYYNAHERTDSALYYAESALRTNPDSQLFLLAQSVYFNIATAKLNQVLELDRRNQPRVYRNQMHKLYMDARPYMEAYRKLAPNERHKWAPALYRIYLNLNMGRQFEEIDKIMRKL